MQNDFLPGGALAVPHGDEILAPLRELMNSDAFDLIVATQDWHPRGHISFASSHPRSSSDGHDPALSATRRRYGRITVCKALRVRGSMRDLPWDKVAAIIRKATDPAVDSYSALRNNWNPRGKRPPTGLTGYLKNHGVREVFVCGLARDFCVRWSAEDAVKEGFRITVIWDLCRSIDPSNDERLRRSLIARGVKIIDRADV